MSACSVVPQIEEPKVTVTGVSINKSISNSGFTTNLSITNPNNFPINITGLYYELKIDEHEVANGTSNEALKLPAYGAVDTDFFTQLNWLEGISLLKSISKNGLQSPQYELKAKLQISGFPIPLTISKKGDLSLN